MDLVTVTTTYLAIASSQHFRPAYIEMPGLHVRESLEPVPAFYRFLYTAVGRDYYWDGRLSWSDARLQAHLARSALTLLVLFLHGTPVGFIELDSDATEPGTELVHLGLLPAYHGRGLGKHLLSCGVQRAFDAGAACVWLHTDNFDSPHALPNYLARGFTPYRTTVHQEPLYSDPASSRNSPTERVSP